MSGADEISLYVFKKLRCKKVCIRKLPWECLVFVFEFFFFSNQWHSWWSISLYTFQRIWERIWLAENKCEEDSYWLIDRAAWATLGMPREDFPDRACFLIFIIRLPRPAQACPESVSLANILCNIAQYFVICNILYQITGLAQASPERVSLAGMLCNIAQYFVTLCNISYFMILHNIVYYII